VTGGVSTVEGLTPAEAADRAAEALRTLNHLTLVAPAAGVSGWEGVGDIYRVIGELRVIVDRLTEVCDQLVAGLLRLGEQREWRTDDGTTEHPDGVVSTAIEHLQVASYEAEGLGLIISHAHCAVARLYQ